MLRHSKCGDERGMIFGISTSQFVSIILVPVSLAMLWKLRPKSGPTLTLVK